MIFAACAAVYADSSSGTIGTDISWTLDEEGNLSITGTGDIPDYNYSGSPFFAKDIIKTITVGDGITKIGSYAFYRCKGLETVTLPPSVESIGDYAISECDNLRTVTFPEGLHKIGYSAFSRCKNLEAIILPDSLQELGEYAFYECTGAATLRLPVSMKKIPRHSFYECSSITAVVFPDDLETIEWSAFYGCRGITVIDLPDGLKTLGDSAFASSSVRNLVIPDSVEEIGVDAFANSDELRSVKLPDALKKIPSGAFSICCKLKSIEIPSGVDEIGYGAFYGCTDLKKAVIPASVKKMEYCFGECFGLDEVYFEGDFPAPLNGSFYACNLTAYYPADNETWTEDILDSGYGGKVKWIGYCASHVEGAAVKENNKAATALAAGSYDLVTYCEKCGTEISRKTVTVKKLTPTIKLSAAKKTLKKGKSYTLKVTGLAKGDSIKSFKSSKPGVAKVSAKGKITAKKKGKAVITVTLKSGKTAKCTITVK